MDRQSHGQEGSLTGRQQAGSQPGQAGREAATWTGRKTGSHTDRKAVTQEGNRQAASQDRQEERQPHGQAGRQAFTWTDRKTGSHTQTESWQAAGRQTEQRFTLHVHSQSVDAAEKVRDQRLSVTSVVTGSLDSGVPTPVSPEHHPEHTAGVRCNIDDDDGDNSNLHSQPRTVL